MAGLFRSTTAGGSCILMFGTRTCSTVYSVRVIEVQIVLIRDFDSNPNRDKGLLMGYMLNPSNIRFKDPFLF